MGSIVPYSVVFHDILSNIEIGIVDFLIVWNIPCKAFIFLLIIL